MNRILIIGSAGQIGGAVKDVLENTSKYSIQGADRIERYDTLLVDITSERSVEDCFAASNPDIVILTAGFGDANRAEGQRALAYESNVQGVENVVTACKKYSAKLIFLSSAYVFDGGKGDYSEDDERNPINYYGETKKEAEDIITGNLKEYIIIRTCWVFDVGYDERNFFIQVKTALEGGKTMSVPNDQWANPTLARNIGHVMLEMIEKLAIGTYHVVGKEEMNKYEWAVKIAEHLDLDSTLLIPVATNTMKQKAPRPLHCTLNCAKATKEFKVTLFSLKESFAFLHDQETNI